MKVKDEPNEEPGAVEPTTATTDGLFMTFNFEDRETNKVAAPAEVPVVAEAKEAEDVKPVEETKQAEKATEAPAAPKTAKRHSYFNVNVFNRERKDKEVAEDKKEEEAKPEPTEPKTEGEAVPAEVKPVDVVAPEASTTAEKSPASSPPKSRFYTGIFDRKSEKAEKVILSTTFMLDMNASNQISRSLRLSLLRLVPSPPLCQSSPLTQLLLPLRNRLRPLVLRLASRSRSASQASSLLSRRRRRPMMSSLTPRMANLLLPSPVHLRFPSQDC